MHRGPLLCRGKILMQKTFSLKSKVYRKWMLDSRGSRVLEASQKHKKKMHRGWKKVWPTLYCNMLFFHRKTNRKVYRYSFRSFKLYFQKIETTQGFFIKNSSHIHSINLIMFSIKLYKIQFSVFKPLFLFHHGNNWKLYLVFIIHSLHSKAYIIIITTNEIFLKYLCA